MSCGRSEMIFIGASAIFLALRVFRLSMISTIVIAIISYLFYDLYWKRRNLPNGPTPHLCFGSIISLYLSSPLDDALLAWHKKYSGIFTVWIGPIPLVMVSNLSLIKKYFVQNSHVFSNRWRNYITDTFMEGENGVVQIDGDKWAEQRRFALRTFRDFGVGKAIIEERIMIEVDAFAGFLSSQTDKLELTTAIAICVGNIINNILFATRYEQNDPKMRDLHGLLDRQSHIVLHPLMGLYISCPFSTKIPLINAKWNELMSIKEKLLDFLRTHIDKHKSNPELLRATPEDFTSAYLQEIEKRRGSEDPGYFDDHQMKMLLLDLFFAGMETTVTTLKWAFLLICKHQEIQRKVQAELDTIQGPITLAHRSKLLYTQATINECQRLANILPINLLRTCSEDIQLDGYFYPKGTLVIPQIAILLNDPEIFTNPKEFNPDRFLDENGQLVRYDEFLPFSVGKRQCLGESLAKAELFMIFANILRQFEFVAAPGEELKDKRIIGLTVSPPRYEVLVHRRKCDLNRNELHDKIYES